MPEIQDKENYIGDVRKLDRIYVLISLLIYIYVVITN